MSALACLRIINDPQRVVAGVETLTLSVRRTAAAWLVIHWARPHRFGEVAPGAFVLAGADVTPSSLASLKTLAGALRHAPVKLAVLRGDQADVTRFAALHAADLRAVLGGLMVVDGMAGEISRVAPTGLDPVLALEDQRPLRLIMEEPPQALAG